MSKLPQVKAEELHRALTLAGLSWRPGKGSHRIYWNPDDPSQRTVVPYHRGQDIKAGTLRGILRDLGWTVDDLLRHL